MCKHIQRVAYGQWSVRNISSCEDAAADVTDLLIVQPSNSDWRRVSSTSSAPVATEDAGARLLRFDNGNIVGVASRQSSSSCNQPVLRDERSGHSNGDRRPGCDIPLIYGRAHHVTREGGGENGRNTHIDQACKKW